MTRYLVGFLCVYALGVMPLVGCSETTGDGGSGGAAGDGGSGGAGGVGGANSAPLDYETNPNSLKYDFSEVDSAAEGFVSAVPSVLGLTLAVVRKDEGQIYEKGYGDFGRDRISLIASTTKVLSVGVILTLVDDGLLGLNRPVAEYVGWGDYHPTVTIEQLLSMMSGIGMFVSDEADQGSCSFDAATTTNACAREIFQDESKSIPPGEEFRYSESAWTLAAGVAEVVSGKPWAELVEERLVTPCGLPNTGYANVGAYTSYPDEFDGDPANIAPSENPQIGGGAYTTVNDYSKVLLMHLNSGVCGEARPERVLSSNMVERMQEDLVPEGVAMPSWSPSAVNYGMGWWKYQSDPRQLEDGGAFGARAVLHPEEGWGAILIIEATGATGSLMKGVLVPLIREAVLAADQT